MKAIRNADLSKIIYYWKYKDVSFSFVFISYCMIAFFAMEVGWQYETDFIYYLIYFCCILTVGLWFVSESKWSDSLKGFYYYTTLTLAFIIFPLVVVLVEDSGSSSLWVLSIGMSVCLLLFDHKTFIYFMVIGQLISFLFVKTLGLPICMDIKNFMMQEIFIILIWLYVASEREKEIQRHMKAINDTTVSLSHELSSYVGSIDLSVNSIHCSNDKDKKFLDNIKYNLRNISHFIDFQSNNLREHIPLTNLEDIDVMAVIKNAIDQNVPENEEKSWISIQGSSFFVKIDPVIFGIVMTNLIKNSLFFIKKKKSGKIVISLSETIDKYVISFKDTGYGIRKEFLPFIFDKGFSRRRYGRGVGLYFCKSALDKYGAKIKCESQFGEFTDFLIQFDKVKNDQLH